jgi:hypothetical protein
MFRSARRMNWLGLEFIFLFSDVGSGPSFHVEWLCKCGGASLNAPLHMRETGPGQLL